MGKEHEQHECQKYRATGTLEESTVRCGECDQMMQGLFFTGIECKTCFQIFHKDCFSLQKDANLPFEEEEEEDIEDPEYGLLIKRDTLELKDFSLEGVDEEKAKELMISRKYGAFLMIDGPNGKMLIIKEHGCENLKRFDIKTVNIHGEDLYFIGQGTSATSILDLVQKVRRTYKLYCPINEPDEPDSDDENTPTSHFRQVDSSDEEEEKPDDESHNAYFWGDITSQEAEDKLKNQHPGTFLLRKNGDIFKLSWISFGGKRNLHAHIKQEVGCFILGSQRFRTICELVAFHQSLPHNFKNCLGGPLYAPEYDQNKTEEEKDLERDVSRRKERSEPTYLQGFQGTVTAKDAEFIRSSRQKPPDNGEMMQR